MGAPATTHKDPKDDPAALAPRGGRYLNQQQRMDIKRDIAHAEAMLNTPESHLRPQVPSDVRRHVQNMTYMLNTQGAPETTGQDLDAVVRRKNYLQDKIQNAMLSSEEMRKNPAGAVGKYQRQEASNEMKANIMEWKNLIEVIDPDSTDPDKANVEVLRRHTTASDLNIANEQIPGTHYSIPSPKFVANYDQTFRSQEIESENIELRRQLQEQIDIGKQLLAAQPPIQEEDDPEEVVDPANFDFVNSEGEGFVYGDDPQPEQGWSDEKKKRQSDRMKQVWAERREKKIEEQNAASEAAATPPPVEGDSPESIAELVMAQQEVPDPEEEIPAEPFNEWEDEQE